MYLFITIILIVIKKYKSASSFVWCQEEPRNMGAWKFIRPHLDWTLEKAGINIRVEYIGRERSASPAVGYLYVHNKQQEDLISQALGI